MRIEKIKEEKEIIEVEEDFRIPGTNIIIEKGDKISVLVDSKKKKESDDEESDEDEESNDDDEVEEKKKK